MTVPWKPAAGPACPLTCPTRLQIGDRNGELTARMNVAQLQLALGRLTSPAAAEKPDLAGYEAQGEFPGWAGVVEGASRSPHAQTSTWDSGALVGRGVAGGGLGWREPLAHAGPRGSTGASGFGLGGGL